MPREPHEESSGGPPGESRGGGADSADTARRLEIAGLSPTAFDTAVSELLRAEGEPDYRVRQLSEWVFRRTPLDFEAMSDLPRRLRQTLTRRFVLHPLTRVEEAVSRDGTRKFLWKSRGGASLESVIIPDQRRVTYCISTQAGCPVKCTFCATGHGGFQAQLSSAEIVDQVLLMRSLAGTAPTNVVFMGMGEPLLNFDAVVAAIEVLTSAKEVAFGARRITVSTVGIPEKIRELGRRHPQVKLALSLHGARDELRDEIIPLNRRYPVDSVLSALRDHNALTGKKVTIEYIVLPGVNDDVRDARDVARFAAAVPSRINLIGYNPFPGGIYEKPSVDGVLRFRRWLRRDYSGDVTVRRSRGEDIQGACGQLSLAHTSHGSRGEST